MMEEDGDQFQRKPGNETAEEERADTDRFFVTFIYLLVLSLTFFACCCACCACFKKCKESINLSLLPANLNAISLTPGGQESRTRAEGCSLPQVNLAFLGPDHQSQGNNFEQSDHLQRTTQANMKSDNVTKINRPPLFSFGNHSKNFPAQSFKYNSPTLTTIIESKLTNDSSPSGLGNPPDVPKTSPPSSELPNTSSLLQHHTDRTLHSTGNPSTLPDDVISIFESPPPSCCYPHYLQSVARPCRTQSSLPVQIRPDFHPNLGQTESHTTGLHPDPHRPHTKNFISFLNSQIHKTSDLPEIIVLPFQGVPLEQPSSQSLPASVELAGNVQTPETTQQSSEEVNKEILENWQSTHFPKSVNDSQSINKPEIYQSTSASSVNNFELSASSDSGYGVSSLFPLGISRLQHYRGFNISPNDINSNDSDSIDRRRYCTRCHLCTLVCECSSSDENDASKTPKDN